MTFLGNKEGGSFVDNITDGVLTIDWESVFDKKVNQ